VKPTRRHSGTNERAMKRKFHSFVILLVVLLFDAACVYSSFDAVMEADFLSGKKYETRDVEEVYAEKQSNPDAVLVSPALFAPLPGILLEFFPGLPSPNYLPAMELSVLRC
jgi:hypothetical protein